MRMQMSQPKQFVCINRLPVIMHTLNVFAPCVDEILLVLPAETMELWNKLQHKYHFDIPHQLVAGGQTRFESIKNATRHLPNAGVVAVHDAVRPCVSKALIERCFTMAEKEKKNVVAACKMIDSVRMLTATGTQSVPRENLMLVQTPQVFACKTLKKAYQQSFESRFTDDAAVVEAMGESVYCVDGEYTNIKITVPSDLKIAKQILNQNQKQI